MAGSADPDGGCDRRGLLTRGGLSQAERDLPARDPASAPLDDRDIADLILFGRRFAAQLRYYDDTNAVAGDFAAFFDSDRTAALAALAKLPVEALARSADDLASWLVAREGRDPARLGEGLKLWFHLPVAVLEAAGPAVARLPAEHPVRLAAPRAVGSLGPALTRFVAAYKGALPGTAPQAGLFDDTPPAPAAFDVTGGAGDGRLRLPSEIAELALRGAALPDRPVWPGLLAGTGSADWADFCAAVAPDTDPYVGIAPGAAFPEHARIADFLGFAPVTGAAERVWRTLAEISALARTELRIALDSFGAHTPQFALWLSFLQLFRHQQAGLNDLTARHMDYYFREVLGFRPAPSVPDALHAVFELARGQNAVRLAAGTILRAGKDEAGQPRRYALDGDLVVNRGVVADLRGLRIGSAPDGTGVLPRAAAVLASQDGMGEVPLAEDAPGFPAFGPAAAPAARVGLSVADRCLFLREGTRTVRLRAVLDTPQAAESLPDVFRARMSGPEGWIEMSGPDRVSAKIAVIEVAAGLDAAASKPTLHAARNPAALHKEDRITGGPAWKRRRGPGGMDKPRRVSRTVLEVVLTLGPDDPAVVPVDPEIHGNEHAAGLPVAELLFDFDRRDGDGGYPAARAYARLADLRARSVRLRTTASGLTGLAVVAGGAPADPSRVFAAFGAQPVAGNRLHVGSAELFAKPMAQMSLTLSWAQQWSTGGWFLSGAASDYDAEVAVLSGGRWQSAAGRASLGLDRTGAVTVTLDGAALIDGAADMTGDNPPLTAGSRTGFLRLGLPRGFGQDRFPAETARALVALGSWQSYAPAADVNVDLDTGLPRQPYLPQIESLSASYVAQEVTPEALRLLGPFGSVAATAPGRLFPDLGPEGSCHVGVAAFDGPARLSLLLQVADGTGDPLLPVPELRFDALYGDTWRRLDAQEAEDGSRNLTRSGVLSLALPRLETGRQTLMPAGLTWLRISAALNADALNHLRGVHAQAARATRREAGPAEAALPAESVTGLQIPDPAIRKVLQPWPGFGGRAPETAVALRRRASERLRHKDRGVTMWDIEALVLQAFPGLHRVKCLNTTELMRDASGTVRAENERRPGAVTVVPVPVAMPDTADDPLRPYADQATLDAVDRHLRLRLPPFVRLEVINPRFEEVLLEFSVAFRPEVADIAFYAADLEAALIAYLSPWSRAGGGEVSFGGRLWKSTVIGFLDDYLQVDFVRDVKMFHRRDPESSHEGADLDVLTAGTGRSVLVSARSHRIHVLSAEATA